MVIQQTLEVTALVLREISHETLVFTPKLCGILYMGVSINGGTPKWMIIRENPIKMDDLGVPPFQETSIQCPINSRKVVI